MRAKLHFVELGVTHWADAVSWFQDTLGLEVLLRDETDRFALLGDGAARLAVKESATVASGALLAFEVEGLDQWIAYLQARGETIEGAIKASAEGYRRVRLRGPEGLAVTLFEWTEARR